MPATVLLKFILVKVKACDLKQNSPVIWVPFEIDVFEKDLRKLFKEVRLKFLSTSRSFSGRIV